MPDRSDQRTTPGPSRGVISAAQIRRICDRLKSGAPVRRRSPRWGRLYVDGKRPFLFSLRRPTGRSDNGTAQLFRGEASYLITDDNTAVFDAMADLLASVAAVQAECFGAFLHAEIWSGPEIASDDLRRHGKTTIAFRIVHDAAPAMKATVKQAVHAITKMQFRQHSVVVDLVEKSVIAPSGMPPLLTAEPSADEEIHTLGIEVPPVYRDAATGEVYPLLLRQFRRECSRALKKIAFAFTRSLTSRRPKYFHSLGRRALVALDRDVDRRLAAVSESFRLIPLVTPVNQETAWKQFRRSRYDRPPQFAYRQVPVEPELLKRRLYAIPVERVEDPVMLHIFMEKQIELDRKITLLVDRETRRFKYGSLQIYPPVEDRLLRNAEGIIETTAPHTSPPERGFMAADEFALRARHEIDYYRRKNPEADFDAAVEIRDDFNGLMVSGETLHVGRHVKIPLSRVDAALNHEVGTHLLTWFNGRSQPFHQLYSGLAGYDELQEGLAVAGEFLGGGLTASRMRILAARVIAVHLMTDGAEFIETFRILVETYRLGRKTAFRTAMRAYRGGGLSKDAVYLRGFCHLIDYLAAGGDTDMLFAGKIHTEHVAVIHELLRRKILEPPPFRPRYMEGPDTPARFLQLCRKDGLSTVFE